MISQITFEEKLIFRNVKKAAIVWLLALRMDPQPITETDAAEILAIDKETARKYLRTLNESQIITRNGRFSGYTLTNEGKQLSLPFQLKQLQPNAEIPRSDLVNTTKINESESINDLVLLINGERGNSALERGNSAFGTETNQPVDKIVDKPGKPTEKPDIDAQVEEILAADPSKNEVLTELLNCSIKMNSRTIELLKSDEITVQEIRSQRIALKRRGKEHETGLLINNLETKFKPAGAELDPKTGHPSECQCYQCIGSRNERFFENFQTGNEYQSWESE